MFAGGRALAVKAVTPCSRLLPLLTGRTGIAWAAFVLFRRASGVSPSRCHEKRASDASNVLLASGSQGVEADCTDTMRQESQQHIQKLHFTDLHLLCVNIMIATPAGHLLEDTTFTLDVTICPGTGRKS